MRITVKGQVTIPQTVREAAGLLPGTDVEFEIGDDGIVRVRRATGGAPGGRLRGALRHLRGASKAGLSTDEIMALTRG